MCGIRKINAPVWLFYWCVFVISGQEMVKVIPYYRVGNTLLWRW